MEAYSFLLFMFELKIHCDLAVIARIWDLSLENDEEEEAEFKAKTKEEVNAPKDLPPQLLFVHQVYIVVRMFYSKKPSLVQSI